MIMLELQDNLDYILSKFKGKRVKIDNCILAPVDETGLEMVCYTPFNPAYPVIFERNLKEQNGVLSKVPCWASTESSKFTPFFSARKTKFHYARDCKACTFTLDKAVSFNIKMFIENTDLTDCTVVSVLKGVIGRIADMLPKPLENITILSKDDLGLYNRRICIKYSEVVKK